MKEESQGKSGSMAGYLKTEVFATPHIHLCVFSFCPVRGQEVMEISVRSRRSQRKVRENGDQKERIDHSVQFMYQFEFLSLFGFNISFHAIELGAFALRD